MKQEINFYQERFHERTISFSFAYIQRFLVSVVVLCMLVNVGFFALNRHYEEKLLNYENRSKTQTAEIDSLITKISQQTIDSDLKIKVDLANKQISAKRKVLEAISNSKGGKAVVFSDILLSLARQHVSGLWLEYINIYNQGTHLSFRGSAVSAGLVPGFIENLKMESAFSGREFESFIMRQDDERKEEINFTLKTSSRVKNDLQIANVNAASLKQ